MMKHPDDIGRVLPHGWFAGCMAWFVIFLLGFFLIVWLISLFI